MNLYEPSTIKAIKNKYGFKFTKSLGQNFLTDKFTIDSIIESADITDEDLVIEIGPGIGVLTAEAAKLAKKVIAIELDHNLIPILNYTLSEYDNIEIINNDVLKTNLNEIIEKENCKRVKIIGNLPYYITTPIVMGILEKETHADSITIMMQKEVAERIEAKAGNKTYGAISVAVQYYCEVETVVVVPKESFIPAPKVDSAVLRLDIRKEKPVDLVDKNMFFKCIKAGFGQRRKTLFNSLTGTGLSKEEVAEVLNETEIDGKRRAETLSIDEFAKIANLISTKTKKEE